MTEIEWKKPIRIPDGKYSGEISKVVEKTEPFSYIDVIVKLDIIKIDDKELDNIEIRYGCPAFLSENSKLGKLMSVFGEEFEEGKKIDPEKLLVGKRVDFMTLLNKNKDGKEFTKIVDGSLKPEESKEDYP